MKNAWSVLSHTIFLHQPLNQSSRGICSQNKPPVLRTHWTRPFTPKCLLQGCRKQGGRSAEHWATSCVCWIWHILHLFLKLWELPSLACNSISLVLALFLVWSSLDFRESQFLRTYSPHQCIGNVVHKHMSSCYSAVRPTGLWRRNKELPMITSVVVIKQSWLKHAQYKNDINDLSSNYESVFSQVEKNHLWEILSFIQQLFIEHLLCARLCPRQQGYRGEWGRLCSYSFPSSVRGRQQTSKHPGWISGGKHNQARVGELGRKHCHWGGGV